MAFRTLITNQVNSAFNLLQDLAENITFTNISVGDGGDRDYNFATGEITKTNPGSADPTSTTIKGVVTKMNKNPSDNTIIEAEVILKSADAKITDLDNYDTINFRNKDWSINSVEDNGFSVTVIAARKV